MRTVEARPVLDGQRVKFTLEQIERENQSKVRIDWLRFTVPLDSVIGDDRCLNHLTASDLVVNDSFARQEFAALTVHALVSADVSSEADLAAIGKKPVVGKCAVTAAQAVAAVSARALCRMLACGFEVGIAEDRGMDFYSVRVPVLSNGAVVGYVMAGSKDSRQAATVHFNLFGQAMLVIPRHRLEVIRSFVAHAKGWITRVDLAVDVWSGRTVEAVQSAWLSGEFDVRGKRPSQQNIGAWASGHSRTFTVGTRGTGKMLRCYEKGDEQFGSRELSQLHGCAEWLRYEVEIRNNHRVIDLDVLIRPADFFAGAYAFCDRLLTELEVEATAQRIKTVPEVADATILAAASRVAAWLDGTAGAAIAAVFEFGGDLIAQVVERNSHRVARRLKGYTSQQIAEALAKVAERLAPAPVPSINGA